MHRRFCWLAAALLGVASCSFDPSGIADDGDASVTPPPDASESAADASAIPDADPSAPDAAPGTPDATPVPDAPGVPDAGIPDAMPDPDAPCPGDVIPFDPSNFDRCALPAAVSTWTIGTGETWIVDTDTGFVSFSGGGTGVTQSVLIDQPGGPQLRAIAAEGVQIAPGGRLAFRGNRPVALVAYGDISVGGMIFAGAVADESGAGADDPTACATGFGANGAIQATGFGDNGGSGGAGGGYGSDGGTGAKVNDSGGADSAAGLTNGTAAIVPLRGGCHGGDGGLSGGNGGGGGGGLQLVAAGNITIGGRVAAPGGGGRGVSGAYSGGGGGGSGGALLLEAQNITVGATGVVSANGGGGGEGSRGGTATPPGEDGHVADGDRALAGGGTSMGGDGGPGAALAGGAGDGNEGTSSSTWAAGGGGGGGGVGRIHFNTTGGLTVLGTVTPAAE